MDSCSAWSGLGPVGRQKEHELEGESPEMLGVHVRPFYEKEKSLFEAIINGANAGVVPRIIGERMIVTEVAAYRDLAAALEQNSLQHPRSAVITTYALCGFAHLASMAIFVGGFCALAPDKTRDVGRVALRALVAATLACLLTACVAGTFFTKGSILLGD